MTSKNFKRGAIRALHTSKTGFSDIRIYGSENEMYESIGCDNVGHIDVGDGIYLFYDKDAKGERTDCVYHSVIENGKRTLKKFWGNTITVGFNPHSNTVHSLTDEQIYGYLMYDTVHPYALKPINVIFREANGNINELNLFDAEEIYSVLNTEYIIRSTNNNGICIISREQDIKSGLESRIAFKCDETDECREYVIYGDIIIAGYDIVKRKTISLTDRQIKSIMSSKKDIA